MVESGYKILESTSDLTGAQQKELNENKSRDSGALGMIRMGVQELIFQELWEQQEQKMYEILPLSLEL